MSWSLEVFLDSNFSDQIDSLAKKCVAVTNDFDVVMTDHLCPFSNEKIGVRITWHQQWSMTLMIRNDETVIDDAQMLARSRTPPAKIRKTLVNCTQAIRVIFGTDDARLYANHIIWITEHLEKISLNRLYDPQQRKFWIISSP